MSDFDMENYYDPPKKTNNFAPVLLGLALFLSASFWYAYANKLLPTFTFVIEDGQVTLKRDDPPKLGNPLAAPIEQQIHNVYKIDGREVSKAEFDAYKPDQQIHSAQVPSSKIGAVQANSGTQPDHPNGQTRKCIDQNNRPVYQTDTCASKGYRTEKMITSADGAVSAAQTHSYKQAEQQSATAMYRIDGKEVSKQEFEINEAKKAIDRQSAANSKKDYCKSLEQSRNYVRSQQKVDSTQYLRDEYDRLSKRWQDYCLGGAGGWS